MQDRVKRLYQRTLGPGHMAPSKDGVLSRLRAELDALSPVSHEEPLLEPIGGGLCRLHLRPAKATGLSADTVGAMFRYTAAHFTPDRRAFAASLPGLAQTPGDRAWLAEYHREGFPSVHHSDAYRDAYAPAYRIVLEDFARALPLILGMDRLAHGIVAIDGPCASGKSTLAAMLGEVFEAGVLHMDDFFLRPEQRTPERLREPGGNVDRERFQAEVLTPLLAGEPFEYRPYDCGTQALAAPVPYAPTAMAIVEGAYSMHPDLRHAYALSAFLSIPADIQQARLLARNGERMLQRFNAEWIPMEQAYFTAFGVKAACDIQLDLTQPFG